MLKPIAFSPELSIRSGGSPPTKRGWSSWAISVVADTFTDEPEKFSCMIAAANDT